MSVREVKPGVWEVVVYGNRREDGSRPRATRRVRGTQRQAEKVETALKAARDEGRPIGPTDTLADYLRAYLRSRRSEVQPWTHAGYERSAERHVIPALGKLKLSEIRPADVRRFYDALRSRGLSGTTILRIHALLRMVFRQAVQDRELTFSPIDAVKAPRTETIERRALSEGEVVGLLSLLRGSPVYLPALVLYDTGLRRGELLALSWRDVDLETGVVAVRRAVEQVGGRLRVKEPKTKRSSRLVQLSAPALVAVKQHRREQLAARAQCANLWRDQGLLFPSVRYHGDGRPMGGLWTPYAFSHAWREAVNKGNARLLAAFVADGGEVKDFEPLEATPHQLRHTFATHALKGGLRLEVVSRALGHSSSHVTATVYSHVIDEEQAATATITGKVLEGLE